MRLENVFLRVHPIVLSLGAFHGMQLDDFLFQQTRLCSAWPARFGIVLAAQDHLETFLDKLPAHSFHSVDARILRLGDPDIAAPLAGFRNIGFQQIAGFRRLLGATPALADRLFELVPFLLAQFHHILLDDLFRRHESSPSAPRDGMDSENPIKRNDPGRQRSFLRSHDIAPRMAAART
jgi:hypothetical protein